MSVSLERPKAVVADMYAHTCKSQFKALSQGLMNMGWLRHGKRALAGMCEDMEECQ